MLKRLSIFSMIVILVISLVGCGKDSGAGNGSKLSSGEKRSSNVSTTG